MLNMLLILSSMISVFAQENSLVEAGMITENKYALIYDDVTTPKDISYINKCTSPNSCDVKKVSEALKYVASVAMSTDYTNNLHDKIADLEKNYKSSDDYKNIKTPEERAKVDDMMKAYIEYLKAVNIEQKIKDAEKRVPLLYGKEKEKQLEYIREYRSTHPSTNIEDKKQALNDAYKEVCAPVCASVEVSDFINYASKEVTDVTYAAKTATDLQGQISSQTLESCKKGSKDQSICKYISSRQSLAFISGNDPYTEVITKYTDKNCPLATRILQEENVKPVLDTLCVGQMNKAYRNQMEYGTAGIFTTLGHVNFVKNICPEMAAQNEFIQRYNLSASGAGLTGLPASFDVAGGTGAIIPNQNILPTNVSPYTDWYNPMWNASNNNVNINNIPGGSGVAPTVKLSPSSATNFYNTVGGGYSKWPAQVNSFIPNAAAQYNAVSNYNSDLSKNVLGYVQNKTAYQGYADAATQLDAIAGGSSVTPEDVRLQITDLKAQDTAIMDEYMGILKNAYLIDFYKRFGNVQEVVDASTAGTRAAQMSIMHSIIQQQIYGLEYQLINYQGYSELFDTRNMYAQAGKDLNIRKNKIKTPISKGAEIEYGLRPDWRSNLKAMSKDMLSKANLAKRNANSYRSNIQKILKKKAPILSLQKLPSLTMLNYEMKNMEAWKKAGIKNMKMIDKAVSDNKLNRMAYDSKSMDSLRSSMGYMVNSIDKTAPSVQKAYSMLNDLYAEAPRTEELRAVAKQMVEQGL